MLTRYGNVDYIFNANWGEAIQLLNKCYERENEDRLFNLYLARYQHMDKNTFVSFEDFKKTNTRRKQLYSTNKSDEEIIAEVMLIKKKFEPGEGEN